MDETANRMMSGIRVYLAFMGLFVLGVFVVNLVQADQTGRGLGVDDTQIQPHDQAKLFHEKHAPRN